jgi:hypothetical protein
MLEDDEEYKVCFCGDAAAAAAALSGANREVYGRLAGIEAILSS